MEQSKAPESDSPLLFPFHAQIRLTHAMISKRDSVGVARSGVEMINPDGDVSKLVYCVGFADDSADLVGVHSETGFANPSPPDPPLNQRQSHSRSFFLEKLFDWFGCGDCIDNRVREVACDADGSDIEEVVHHGREEIRC